MNNNYIVLKNGMKIPRIGFGTWLMYDRNDRGKSPVLAALKCGCRLIDTAQEYLTEEIVGSAIKESGIPRSEITVTTKLSPEYVYDYYSAKVAIEESLRKLDTGYIDVMYIHAEDSWANGEEGKKVSHDNIGIVKALLEAKKSGKIKSYGISNFSLEELEKLEKSKLELPDVIQMPYSVGTRNDRLIDFCKKNSIKMVAYSPLSSGNALKDPIIKKIAAKYNKEPSEVCFSYVLQTIDGYVFSSGNINHIKSGINVKPFLNDEDIREISRIKHDYLLWTYQNGFNFVNEIDPQSSMSEDALKREIENIVPQPRRKPIIRDIYVDDSDYEKKIEERPIEKPIEKPIERPKQSEPLSFAGFKLDFEALGLEPDDKETKDDEIKTNKIEDLNCYSRIYNMRKQNMSAVNKLITAMEKEKSEVMYDFYKNNMG